MRAFEVALIIFGVVLGAYTIWEVYSLRKQWAAVDKSTVKPTGAALATKAGAATYNMRA